MTAIEWTDETWNPVTGCTKVSQGCKNCYAETVAKRFWGSRPFAEVRTHPERIDQPLHWRKPRRVFVNSMSDLFEMGVSGNFIEQVLNVCDRAAAERGHVFQILTKRPKRMQSVVSDWWKKCQDNGVEPMMDNIWLGVSVEDQKTADERIPILLETPAAVRFISAEPLLGPIDLRRFLWPVHASWPAAYRTEEEARAAGAQIQLRPQALVYAGRKFLDWVIVGGESGPQARSCNVEWIRSIVAECQAAGVPVFVKQLGSRPVFNYETEHADALFCTITKKGGDMAEWPEDLRVREFPRMEAAR